MNAGELGDIANQVADIFDLPGAVIILFNPQTEDAKVAATGLSTEGVRHALAVASFYNEREGIEGSEGYGDDLESQ